MSQGAGTSHASGVECDMLRLALAALVISPPLAEQHSATALPATATLVCVAVPGKWGDVTGDGRVNIIDAQRVSRFAAGLSVGGAPRMATNGDVNGDGAVDVIDAQLIARFTVALSAARVGTDVFTPPVVTSLGLTPATPQSLGVGETLQLTASPRDASNADVTGCAAVSWSSSNTGVATVSASGLVVANGAGSATITARSAANAAVFSSMLVNVAGPAQTPIVFFTESFDAPGLAARGWYDNTNVPLSLTEKHAGASAAEYRFVAGARTPVSGGSIRRKFTPSNSVYISYWVKYSDNWVGSTWAYHPHEFHVMSDADPDYAGPGNAQLTLYVEHSYQNGNRPRLGMQDNKAINLSYGTPPINLTAITENRSVSGCNGVVESGIFTECFPFPNETPPWYNSKQILGPVVMQPTPGPGYKGNWNRVEAYFEMNTIVDGIGQPNGVIRYWFNGTQVISRQDVVFRTGARPTLQFSQFVIAPYIGGVGSSVQQSMWVDDITVASGRIQ